MSVESCHCISHFHMENSKRCKRATILSDGRICVGGMGGYCAIFGPPQEVERIISEYAGKMHCEARRVITDIDLSDDERDRVGGLSAEKHEKRDLSDVWEAMEKIQIQCKARNEEMRQDKHKMTILELQNKAEQERMQEMESKLQLQDERIESLGGVIAELRTNIGRNSSTDGWERFVQDEQDRCDNSRLVTNAAQFIRRLPREISSFITRPICVGAVVATIAYYYIPQERLRLAREGKAMSAAMQLSAAQSQ